MRMYTVQKMVYTQSTTPLYLNAECVAAELSVSILINVPS